jgi:hypothetical protein
MKDLIQDIRCSGRDSNKAPPEYQSGSSPLGQPVQWRMLPTMQFNPFLKKITLSSTCTSTKAILLPVVLHGCGKQSLHFREAQTSA